MANENSTTLFLLDIEGTTTPIDFVYKTLFPYVREHLESFLSTHWEEEAVQRDLKQVARDMKAFAREEGAPALDAQALTLKDVLEALRWQMDHDKKCPGLKSLQGKIWQAGYIEGTLEGEVYEDVLVLLEKISNDANLSACIYSSGSVQAQKLLFKHSKHGDLTAHLSGYYDTLTGPKKEAQSYRAIARAEGVDLEQILFLTDNIDEARAARDAGIGRVVLSVRPGNAPLPEGHGFEEVTRFDKLI